MKVPAPSPRQVRAADGSDIVGIVDIAEQVQSLHANAYPDVFLAPDRADLATFLGEQLHEHDVKLLVATDSHKAVVGYALAVIEDRPANVFTRARRSIKLDQLAVRSAVEGQGYGQALLAAVRALGDSRQADDIELTVWLFNERAVEFYRRAGFTATRLDVKQLCRN